MNVVNCWVFVMRLAQRTCAFKSPWPGKQDARHFLLDSLISHNQSFEYLIKFVEYDRYRMDISLSQ